MGLRSHYLVRHGTGYRFQMAVPNDLQALLGRKMWRRYLAVRSEPEARLLALHLAAKCRREIHQLRTVPHADRTESVDSNKAQEPELAEVAALLSVPFESRSRTAAAVTTPVQNTAGAFVSVTSLVDVWQRVAQPRAAFSVLRMKRCADEFVALVGSLAASQVTRAHVMQYRDMLEGKKYSRSTAKNYLDCIHRLFAVAHSEGVVESNPAAGIRLRSGHAKFADRQRRRPFEHHELHAMFVALASEPEPCQWLVKLLAYHGMRSGEASQLRVEDITTLFDVPVLRVHDRFGSLKNRHSQRDIPLHPKCRAFIDFARTVSGPWVFPQETLRSDRFQRYAGDFLRKKVKLTDRTLTMHSLRHTWRTMAREISMPSAVSRAIMGHSMGRDVHEEYGGGPSLRLMAEWLAKIEVMPQAGSCESQ